jgi:hypothetical protein
MYKVKDKNRAVVFVALTIIFSLALSYIPGGIKILWYEVKTVDFFMDIKPDSLLYETFETYQEEYPSGENGTEADADTGEGGENGIE